MENLLFLTVGFHDDAGSKYQGADRTGLHILTLHACFCTLQR